MRRTILVCDLHENGDLVPAIGTVNIHGVTAGRRLDVCAAHEEWLLSLGQPGTSGAEPHPARKASTAAPTNGEEALSSTVTAGQRQPGSRRSLQAERAAVREWARGQGRDVADKGRLPSGLVEEYRRRTRA